MSTLQRLGFTGVRGDTFWIQSEDLGIVPHMPMPSGGMMVKFVRGQGWTVVKAS